MDSTSFNYVLTQFGIVGLVLCVVLFALYRLGSDLAKLRTELQQQVTRDLLNKRFDAYGRLWATMKPIAIYSDDVLSPSKVRSLGEALSGWYFSVDGGMFLTSRARDFYFALQDTLEAAGELKGWKCTHRPDDVKGKFKDLLSSFDNGAGLSPETLDHPENIDPMEWRSVCRNIAARLKSLPTEGGVEVNDTVFAAVQQISSALRSILAFELRTRLELNVPRL